MGLQQKMNLADSMTEKSVSEAQSQEQSYRDIATALQEKQEKEALEAKKEERR